MRLNFIDDGAATEPMAVKAAVETFTQDKNNFEVNFLWLFLTGLDKNSNTKSTNNSNNDLGLSELVKQIQLAKTHHKIFEIQHCGQIGAKVRTQGIGENNFEILNFKQTTAKNLASLDQITLDFETWLTKTLDKLTLAEEFDTLKKITQAKVLNLNLVLSPCGSSFDEFSNYQERSKWWADTCLLLAHQNHSQTN